MKVYISGALDASQDLQSSRAKYDGMALELSSFGFYPYVPHHKTDPVVQADVNSVDVFDCDLAALSDSDLIVAFFDEPSFGVGAEVAIAIEKGIPVVGLIAEGKKFSRFLHGLILSSRNSSVYIYKDLDSAATSIRRQFLP